LPATLDDACLVLTAGTTGVGAIDALERGGEAAWTHVDAAWAGPLRLSDKHGWKLDGIERADSVSVSAHKLLFQPKESAMVLFKRAAEANSAITFTAGYLDAPNIGLQGSHGAVAVPLLATLLAWGKSGIAERVDRCMEHAAYLAAWVNGRDDLELYVPPRTGIVVWRSRAGRAAEEIAAALPPGCASLVSMDGEVWLRNVAANPCADPSTLVAAIRGALAAS
jgi:L-2,4-diaminobutyrate decarboxylase